MIAVVRAGCLAALVALACAPAFAAEKAFQSSDLSDAAIKLEAQIKTDAGKVTKSPAVLRKDADAAFVRAVSPGRYVLPQASVEDMYRPDRFARTGTGTIEVTAAK